MSDGDAWVSDFDDVIIVDPEGKTVLERLILDFNDTQSTLNRVGNYSRGALFKFLTAFSKASCRIFKRGRTGESSSLKLCDWLILSKMKMPVSFMEQQLAEYAKLITPECRQAIKSCSEHGGHVYIASGEPTQITWGILKRASLTPYIKEVYGNRFEIKDGVIIGLDRYELVAGVGGKHLAMREITSNGYKTIHAIGHSDADKGLFERHKGKVRPYTIPDASEEFRSYVEKHGGKVLTIDKFFSDS